MDPALSTAAPSVGAFRPSQDPAGRGGVKRALREQLAPLLSSSPSARIPSDLCWNGKPGFAGVPEYRLCILKKRASL